MSDKVKRKIRATNSNATKFLETILKGKRDSIGKHVKKGIDVNSRDTLTGDTALHIAIDLGNMDLVNEILKHSPDVNAASDNGHTPLHKASLKGLVDVVRLLLAHKAYVEIEDKEGQTPLFSAVCGVHLEIINLLIEQGANVHTMDKNENTLVHEAAKTNTKVLQTLLRKGVEVNKLNRLGCTALHVAAEEGNTGCISALLGNNIDTTIKNKAGDTAADLAYKAKFAGHEDIAKLLRKPPRTNLGGGSSSESRLASFSVNDLPPLPSMPTPVPREWIPSEDFPNPSELPPPLLSSGDQELASNRSMYETDVEEEDNSTSPAPSRLGPSPGGAPPALPARRGSGLQDMPRPGSLGPGGVSLSGLGKPNRPPPGPPPSLPPATPGPGGVQSNSPRARTATELSGFEGEGSPNSGPNNGRPLPGGNFRGVPPMRGDRGSAGSFNLGSGGDGSSPVLTRGPPLRGKASTSMQSLPGVGSGRAPPLRPAPGPPPPGGSHVSPRATAFQN